DYKVTGVQTCALPISQGNSFLGLTTFFALAGGLGGQAKEAVALSEPETFVEPPVALGTAVDEQVLTLAFTPDDKRLVIGGGRPGLPGQMQIWDVAGGRNLFTKRGIDGVEALAVSPNGK